MRQSIEKQWYGRPGWLLLLAPLSGVFSILSALRRRIKERRQKALPLPVVVIGNISVGGTGKTPVIIALVDALRRRGWRPGVISRGYGGTVGDNHLVSPDDLPEHVGDEPLLIARATQCPVAVGRNRVDSVELLAKETTCNVVLSDDGMQHYQMARDMEIAVIDGSRGFGNGWLLPVGPLRETVQRLQQVDWVLFNGEQAFTLPVTTRRHACVTLRPTAWRNLQTGAKVEPDALTIKAATAIAGIGHPQRFFDTLATLGFDGATVAFPDHHAFNERDLSPYAESRLLMTEKDAVKCARWAGADWWVLQVGVVLPQALVDDIETLLNA